MKRAAGSVAQGEVSGPAGLNAIKAGGGVGEGQMKRESVSKSILSHLKLGRGPGRSLQPLQKYADRSAGLQATNRATNRDVVGRLTRQIGQLQRRQRHAQADTIMGLLSAVEAKDPYTRRHCQRVAAYAEKLCEVTAQNAADTETIVIAALLHDVGKIGIADAILTKPGALTTAEFEAIKAHPGIGVAILRRIDFLRPLLPLVMHHHERHDGGGYPDRLNGARTPTGAKIIQTADSIDAMLAPRSYRRPRSVGEVIAELDRCKGTQFDPMIAEAAAAWLATHPPVSADAASPE